MISGKILHTLGGREDFISEDLLSEGQSIDLELSDIVR